MLAATLDLEPKPRFLAPPRAPSTISGITKTVAPAEIMNLLKLQANKYVSIHFSKQEGYSFHQNVKVAPPPTCAHGLGNHCISTPYHGFLMVCFKTV